VGYQFANFDNSGSIFDQTADSGDWYGNIVLSHRINAYITQSISAGHEAALGVNSNFVQLDYVRHTATWAITSRLRNRDCDTRPLLLDDLRASVRFDFVDSIAGASPKTTPVIRDIKNM